MELYQCRLNTFLFTAEYIASSGEISKINTCEASPSNKKKTEKSLPLIIKYNGIDSKDSILRIKKIIPFVKLPLYICPSPVNNKEKTNARTGSLFKYISDFIILLFI